MQKATRYFEDAIIEDPKYALAYAGLSDAYATLAILDSQPPQAVMPKAQSAAQRALEIDPELGEAHASLAYIKHRFEWDWAGAEREFKRTIELSPGYATAHQWYGWYLVSLGQFDQALAEFRQAQQLDPLSLYVNLTLGAPYFHSSQFDRAVEPYRRVVEMDASFPLAHRWLAKNYVEKGMYAEALAEAETYLTLSGGSQDQTPMIGYIYARMGKAAEARRVIAQLKEMAQRRYVSAYSLAIVYAGLGEKDQAFAWLRKDFDERDASMVFLKFDPPFDSLHADPRFAELLQDMGLPPVDRSPAQGR